MRRLTLGKVAEERKKNPRGGSFLGGTRNKSPSDINKSVVNKSVVNKSVIELQQKSEESQDELGFATNWVRAF